MRLKQHALLFLPLLLIVMGCNDTKREHFDNLVQAKRERMIEKGYIPVFIPDDATDINAEADLDISYIYGSFASEDASSIRRHCARTEGALIKPQRAPQWFPVDLINAKWTSELESKGYEIFTCSRENMQMAILRSQNKVFYWAEPSHR